MFVSAGPRGASTLTRNPVAALSFVLVLAAMLVVAPSAPAGATTGILALTNSARMSRGLPALTTSADLTAAASQQAGRMAGAGRLYHTPNLGGAVCCWSALGENVGEGASTNEIFSAFMASAEHRANILNGSYTQVGVGLVVDASGRMWVSEIFRRPSGAVAAPPSAAPAPRPRPAPARTHAPAQAPAPAPAQRATVRAVAPPADPPPPPTRASRDLAGGRLPIEAAQRFAAELAGASAAQGFDPVSRMLDFVAATARQNG